MSYHSSVKRKWFIFLNIGSTAPTSNIIPYSNGLDALPPVIDTVKVMSNAILNRADYQRRRCETTVEDHFD